jgi:ATP-binding cassette, subfamily F, member 3
MLQAGSDKSEMELRGVLGCFLFSNEDVFKKIKVLSGGEKSRVALAKTLISESNFLLLDEPTNHLDMQSVNILIQALEQFEGTFITVSHDRHFIKGVANKIWYIENHEIKEYLGTYDEYVNWKATQVDQVEPKVPAPKKEPVVQKEVKKSASVEEANEAKKQLKKLEKEFEEVEGKILQLEEEKKQIEAVLADPGIYDRPADLESANAKYLSLTSQEKEYNAQWEKLAEKIEQLQEQLA